MTRYCLAVICIAFLRAAGMGWQANLWAAPVPASSANLAITEILYYPPQPSEQERLAGFPDQNDFEFVELLNLSDQPISLDGVAFTDGIDFDFSGILDPHAFTVVVRNLAAFRLRYGTDIPVAGQYSGRLANEGEVLGLSDPSGAYIRVIYYLTGAGWPTIPLNNPGGHSLELLDPKSNPDASKPIHWRASIEPEGTPGRSPDTDDDGLRDSWEMEFFGSLDAQPGDDPDADGLTNLTELILGTHPKNSDTDQDGLQDGVETKTGIYVNASDTGTDPISNDTDLDGLKDGVETNTRVFVSLLDTGTHPLQWDTDGDGHADGTELRVGKDPLDPTSFPVAATISRFEVQPTVLTVGESITFTWDTAAAEAVYIEPGIGPVANPSGQLTWIPDQPGFITYYLTASNSYWSAEHNVRIRVFPDAPPVINEFLVTPSDVGRGGKVELHWTLDGIVEEVSIDQGVGLVTGNAVIVSPSAAQFMVPKASVWRYMDDGSDQGTAWKDPDFDDSAWKSGQGPLGYGNPGLNTIVEFGDIGGTGKYITTYFRKKFLTTDPASLTGLRLRLMRDDGAQIFLNGVEILRDLLPEGPIGYQTLASIHSPDDGMFYHEFLLDPLILREGINVLAVGLHQASPVSADTQFDLELLGEPKADQSVTYTLTASNGAGSSTAQLSVTVRQALEELISYFDDWRYEDTGIILNSDWKEPGYADFSWSSGPGVLGIETAGPAAPLMHTPLLMPIDHGSVITYFRTKFFLPVSPSLVRSLTLTHLVDDGAYVYLNGQEVHRIGVDPLYPLATRVMGDIDFEGPFPLPTAALVQGENVLAVELYQPYITTTDIVWGGRLDAEFPLAPLGPHLTIARTETGLRIQWSAIGYDLEMAEKPNGPWDPIATTGMSHDVTSPGEPAFFRLRKTGF